MAKKTDHDLLIELNIRTEALERAESQRTYREWVLIVAIVVALVKGFLGQFTGVNVDQAAIWLLGIVF